MIRTLSLSLVLFAACSGRATGSDAGRDLGPGGDAGHTDAAGSDAGHPMDGMVATDSGGTDTGTALDSGSATDSGTAADAGTGDGATCGPFGCFDAGTSDGATCGPFGCFDAGSGDSGPFCTPFGGCPDAGATDAGVLGLGDPCTRGTDPMCGPGLTCCYPCGIDGCSDVCMTTCTGPGCAGGCGLFP